MSAPVEPIHANEPGIIPGSLESLSNEDLAVLVRDGLQKFSKLVPYVRELRIRFADLPRGKANIMGCASWTQFCEKVLGRTDSAVRKALSTSDAKKPVGPRNLLRAVKLAIGVSDYQGSRPLHFSLSENGRVRLSMKNLEYGYSSQEEFDEVPTPLSTTSVVENPHSVALLFDCDVHAETFRKSLEKLSADPTITFRGVLHPLISESADGRLHFLYDPSMVEKDAASRSALEERAKREAEEERRAEEEREKRLAAYQAELDKRYEEERPAREERQAAQREKERQRDVIRERAVSLEVSIPGEYVPHVMVSGNGKIGFGLERLTLEQFERIVEALQQILGTRDAETSENGDQQ
jgi:hypothetical protein